MEDVIKKDSTKRRNNRYVMYVNQLEHMTLSFDDLFKKLITLYPQDYKKVQFAMIVHDKDVDKDGELIKPHVHVSIYSRNGMSLKFLTDIFEDDEKAHFEYMRDKDTSFLYLTHRTKGAQAQHKFLYPLDEVKANFDYPEFVINKSNGDDQVEALVTGIVQGKISKNDLLDNEEWRQLYARNRRRLDYALLTREDTVKRQRKKMIERNGRNLM